MIAKNAVYRLVGRVCPPISGIETRVCGRLQRWLPPAADRPVRAGNGFLVTGDTSNVPFLTGLHEREYVQLLSRLIRPGQTVYDVGANTGYLALWLCRHFKEQGEAVELVAFEPEPRTVDWLRDNVVLNPGVTVRVEPIALGAATGTLTLWSAGRGDGSVSADPNWVPRSDRGAVEVPVKTMDDYCARSDGGAPVKPPSWIVLDVEGFGHDVIAGAAGVIETAGPAVAAEIHTEAEHRGIDTPLRRAGYRVTHELKSGWGQHIIWQRG
jgi:FkbM family methyltransferase